MFLTLLLFLVGSNGPRAIRNLTSCIRVVVHWETRSNNIHLYTIQSRSLSLALSSDVPYSCSFPFINLYQELLQWYFCRLSCLIRVLKKVLWLTFRSIWKILWIEGLDNGWFPLSRFEPICWSLLHILVSLKNFFPMLSKVVNGARHFGSSTRPCCLSTAFDQSKDRLTSQTCWILSNV